MAAGIELNIGSGNGLLTDGTKPLPEPTLTYHQWVWKTFTWKKFHERYPNNQSLKWTWNETHITKTLLKSPKGQWDNKVLHMLTGAEDNGLTGDFLLERPDWNNMARLSWHDKFLNPLQIYRWVICFEIKCTWEQMSHRVMFAYWCWLEI